ncbi:50S ribosomal protein L7ae-like protein [Bacillus piscicola]|uniref:50S ribosomal protein L7ae-like protein n=1 Tax=Bacillus piscicola TaxID=1632684 RepID=UPI001F09689B|nr:50S ribosomal protein L7ae-like protein [Bacillus piscicola]
MSYEKVSQAAEVLIGTKQTLKALESNSVDAIIVADDADSKVVEKVLIVAEAKGVLIHKVDSMKKLGKACGIDVGAAAVALKKR